MLYQALNDPQACCVSGLEMLAHGLLDSSWVGQHWSFICRHKISLGLVIGTSLEEYDWSSLILRRKWVFLLGTVHQTDRAAWEAGCRLCWLFFFVGTLNFACAWVEVSWVVLVVVKVVCAANRGSETQWKKKFKRSSHVSENVRTSCSTNDSYRFLTTKTSLNQIRSRFPSCVLVPKWTWLGLNVKQKNVLRGELSVRCWTLFHVLRFFS